MQRRIKRAWFPPKGNESKRVVVEFEVHKGGELSNLKLVQNSGMALADQAALKAVENAAPFRPFPSGMALDWTIKFTFDSNLFNGGGQAVIVNESPNVPIPVKANP
jgi:TonB family protein